MAEIKSLIDQNVIYVDNVQSTLVQVPKGNNKVLLYMDMNDFAALISAYNSKELTSLRTQRRNNKNPQIINSTICGLNYVLLNSDRNTMAASKDIMSHIAVDAEEFNTRVFVPSGRKKAAIPKLGTTSPQLLNAVPLPMVNTPLQVNNGLLSNPLQPGTPEVINLPHGTPTPGTITWMGISTPVASLKLQTDESEVSEDN